MGYTHYFTQTRDYTPDEWAEISADVATLLAYVENEQGVALRSWDGTGLPLIDADSINFNGASEDSHENFRVERIRELDEWQTTLGASFCKTARKPYDVAVTAALCYLATITESHYVDSDGKGRDWLAGLELARQALPRYANRLDIPRPILESDRWCCPHPNSYTERYLFACCVDGYAYIIDNKSGASYRFYSHFEAAQWSASHIEKPITVDGWSGKRREGGQSIFEAYGSFDSARHKALRLAQDRAFKAMLALATGDRALPPPAFVRPGEMPLMDEAPRAYSLADLLKLAA